MLAGLALFAQLVHYAETSLQSRQSLPAVQVLCSGGQEGDCLTFSWDSFKDAGYGTLTESLPEAEAQERQQPQGTAADAPASDRPSKQTEPVEFAADLKSAVTSQESTAPIQESTASIQESTAPIQESTAPIQESTASIQESITPIQEEFTAPIQEESTASIQESTAPVQELAATIQEESTAPIIQASTAPIQESTAAIIQESTAPIQESTAPIQESAAPGTLDRLRKLAPVLFDRPTDTADDDAELTGLSPFPSLPNSRLRALGLLPDSLAQLQAANAAVSIVDPNSRYRMEGSPPPTPTPGEAATAEDRVRELGISFANDAATIGERVKRVSLARASLEANLAGELEQLEASLAAGSGAAAASAVGSVRVLRDTAARLNRTAEALGAVEQECRLNFAFHLIHKFSDELRSEKERMAGELEILRQAVEDEAFYAEGSDATLGKCAKPGTASVKGRAKFQQLGRNVARTSSVASLLQRLGRDRERRKRQAGDEAGTNAEWPNAAADGKHPDQDEVFSTSDTPSSSSTIGNTRGLELEESTVLDRLDKQSSRLFADRRVRLLLIPASLMLSLVFLLWAIAYPIVKRLLA